MKPITDAVLFLVKYDQDAPGCVVVERGTVCLHDQGYYTVNFIEHGLFLAHRLVWALHHGDPGAMTIEYRDYDRKNNRIDNLRKATKAQQMYNQGAPAHNTSGVKGLRYSEKAGGWYAEVKFNLKQYTKFSKSREVCEAWLVAKRAELHKEFAHG